jgi:hypothetical protein
MQYFRKFLIEIIGVPIILAWLFFRVPEAFDAAIPWVALVVVWHITWEFVLDTKIVRGRAVVLGKRVNHVMIWFVVFVFGGLVSLAYWKGINKSLMRLASIANTHKAQRVTDGTSGESETGSKDAGMPIDTSQTKTQVDQSSAPQKLKPTPQQAEPPHHPPKVKQWAVATMIPFEKTEYGGGVPVEDSNAISHDPLSKTYSDIRNVARLRAKTDNSLNPVPVTDDEAVGKTSEALRYCLLRWIAEIQNPVTYFSYKQGVGGSSTTAIAVPVPDGEPYPKDKLEEVLKATNIGVEEEQHHWFWELQDNFKFDVPANSTIEANDEFLSFGNDHYKLQFTVEYIGKNGGAAALPAGFVMAPGYKRTALLGLNFAIKGRMEWYGAYSDADPYMDWANGLFAGLDERLKMRPPTSN